MTRTGRGCDGKVERTSVKVIDRASLSQRTLMQLRKIVLEHKDAEPHQSSHPRASVPRSTLVQRSMPRFIDVGTNRPISGSMIAYQIQRKETANGRVGERESYPMDMNLGVSNNPDATGSFIMSLICAAVAAVQHPFSVSGTASLLSPPEEPKEVLREQSRI